jgi:hypothetical protein
MSKSSLDRIEIQTRILLMLTRLRLMGKGQVAYSMGVLYCDGKGMVYLRFKSKYQGHSLCQ